ncbi:hypothetical protein NDU88_006545 [Pleurodeles waltl]|uniref:Uncharacterized protein n=1 Tax=Pleurodeles waltl TaxID=8319 RepID=A0AAV7PIM9_PLEWA|nr:hypothetical protein NDU88_006545 [Pleurodeles waltl]
MCAARAVTSALNAAHHFSRPPPRPLAISSPLTPLSAPPVAHVRGSDRGRRAITKTSCFHAAPDTLRAVWLVLWPVALIAADTAARADQLVLGIVRAAEVLTRGHPSLFGVPFHVVSTRNIEHSEEGNGRLGVDLRHRRKLNVVALIAADTAAGADQLCLGIALAAEVLTRSHPSLFRVPFRVISARNIEHSEEGNGRPGCRSGRAWARSSLFLLGAAEDLPISNDGDRQEAAEEQEAVVGIMATTASSPSLGTF